jgi:hypothetical protein
MRPIITIGVGALIATVGIVIFLGDRSLATPPANQLYSQAERDMFQILWACFGIAIWLGGVAISAVGFAAWCRNGAHDK